MTKCWHQLPALGLTVLLTAVELNEFWQWWEVLKDFPNVDRASIAHVYLSVSIDNNIYHSQMGIGTFNLLAF